jgi:hypothetical protein
MMSIREVNKFSYVGWNSYFFHTPEEERGIKLVSHKNFAREKFRDALNTGLLDCFAKLSLDYGDFWVYEIGYSTGFFVSYWTLEGLQCEEAITCDWHPDMRLEFETEGPHSKGAVRYVAEFLDDPVFGKIVRIRECHRGFQNIITALEDGRIIAVTDDEATGDEWLQQEQSERDAGL